MNRLLDKNSIHYLLRSCSFLSNACCCQSAAWQRFVVHTLCNCSPCTALPIAMPLPAAARPKNRQHGFLLQQPGITRIGSQLQPHECPHKILLNALARGIRRGWFTPECLSALLPDRPAHNLSIISSHPSGPCGASRPSSYCASAWPCCACAAMLIITLRTVLHEPFLARREYGANPKISAPARNNCAP